MQKALILKLSIIGALSLVMVILINLVGGVVDERQQRQQGAVTEIAASFSGAQRTASPVLVIPYVEEYDENELDDKGKLKKIETRQVDHQLVYFPSAVTVNGSATTDWKHRGLFRALVYEWQADEAGTFELPAVLPYEHQESGSRIIVGTPGLIVPLTDPRGLVHKPEANLDGHPMVFERGEARGLRGSIQASIPMAWLATGKPIAFTMRLGLRGTQSFGFVPYGNSTRVTLKSGWPSPSFGGAFLPIPQLTRTSDSGFEAAWEVSGLASSAGADLVTCIAGKACAGVANEQAIEVNLIEPINIYSLSNRAIKYGFLFVVLIFAGFFLFELVKRLRIHPAQYFLVGLAIAVFFLLLISLSEHFDFWIAYVVAATASTALITAYLTGVLGGLARALGFGLGLGILYSCLYGLLSSEDNALALGSILIFVILAAAMMITRKLDWYSLQESIGS